MRVTKAMLGAAVVVVVSLLSACGTGEEPQAQVGDTTTTKPTTTTTVAPTTTSTTTVVPTTTPPPVTTTTKPKPTTTKPKPPTTTPPAAAVGAPCKANVDACIDLSANKSWLLKDGKVVYGPVPITHGRPGYRTPPGTFKVGWKDIDHKSSIFNNAPMPYSVFFNGGIAFHAGSLSVQSHGCIHLSNAAAKQYYNSLAVGDLVQVVP